MTGPFTVLESCPPPDAARVELLCARYGGAVPPALLNRVIRLGVERTDERQFTTATTDIEVEWWLNLAGDANDILRMGDDLHPDRLSPALLPFGVGGGAVLCICTDARDRGAVYRWLAEGEGTDIGDENVERICEDVETFFRLLTT